MNTNIKTVNEIYSLYRQALRHGDTGNARRLAQAAMSLAPDQEETWLYLAAVASPRASLYYLNRALDLNPSSQRARQGISWAVSRLRQHYAAHPKEILIIPQSIPSTKFIRRHQRPPWISILLIAMIFSIFLMGTGWLINSSLAKENGDSYSDMKILAKVSIGKATRTSTFTPTFTPTSTPTITPTPTSTATPTITPTPTDTSTPEPTNTPEPPQPIFPNISIPSGVDTDERWIDINLSEQKTYAYEGDQLINSFIVSTGTWQYPTVTGTYQVYVKYQAADMSGPGYYLPSVPYVMYFFKGYGLHGTYWHNNFGTPMSHGCVNLRTEDAGWLFDWAEVGTVVNVHY